MLIKDRSHAVLTSMLAVTVVLSACSSPRSGESDEPAGDTKVELGNRVELTPDALASIRLTYTRAETMELSPSLEVPAEVVPVPDRLATIGTRVAGRVVRVLVNTGEGVRARDPLVQIESPEVGRAWANLIAARARESVARRARDREERLLESRITSAREAEEAEGSFQVAAAELQAARTRLATYGVETSGSPPTNPALVTLRSPVAGTVTVRAAHVGKWVETSETLIQVVDLDYLWLEAKVYEQQMRFVQVGQLVQVEVRALPDDVFQGVVEQVEGVLDESTRSVGVRIGLPNPEHRLRPGMFAIAKIKGNHDREARRLVAIPWSAVQEIDGRQVVFLRLGDGAFELRAVHTAARVGDYVEVLTGIEPGEELVADGSFLLKGQFLRATLAEEEDET